jgi:hypothetical protein
MKEKAFLKRLYARAAHAVAGNCLAPLGGRFPALDICNLMNLKKRGLARSTEPSKAPYPP